MTGTPNCPLCEQDHGQYYQQDKRRSYWLCPTCQLVFVDPDALPTRETERQIYDLHQNSPDDLGYRKFLERLANPLCERLGTPPMQGLDFGCGPGPTFSVMLTERGHNMHVYDPIYATDRAALSRQYDFITCTEVIEHFHRPGHEWQQLLALLKPGGWLGIMTKLHTGPEAFSRWHYKNDITHVSFFSRVTFAYIASRYQLELEFVGADVILLQKPLTPSG